MATRRDSLRIFHAAEPAHQDDGEADQADLRRHVHFERRPHRDEGYRYAGQGAEQGRPGRDFSNIGRDESPDHQNKTLEEHPDQASRPALDRIAGLDSDRQHDHEGDDEHVRHADAGRKRTDVGAAGPLREAIGEPGIVEGGEAHHQPERRQDAAEHQAVRHFQHEPQQPGQHQHVDQDVGAEAEEGVPVARRPQHRLETGFAGSPHVSSAHRFPPAAEMFEISGAIASRTAAESLTQPKMPPWALIIFRPISWNSGKYDAQPSASTTQR
jgi:hypothetical protein